MTDQSENYRRIDELNGIAWNNRVTDSKKAAECSKEAIALSRSINYIKGLADGLIVEGFCFIRVSDFVNASAALDEAEQLCKETGDFKALSAIYEYNGIITRYQGNNGASLEFLFKALDLSRQTGFTESEITNLYQLGVTYRQLANYEKALEYLFESLALSRSRRDSLIEGYNLNVIGSIYFETGDYTQALEYFKQALLLRQQSGDRWGEAGSLDNIGHAYLKLSNFEEAIDHFIKSLEISRQSGDKKGQGNALLHLAEVYGLKNDYTSATEFSKQSLIIRRSVNDKHGESEILLFQAELMQRNNSDFPGILRTLSQALSLSEEIGATDLLSNIHLFAYIIFKKKGDFNNALEHFEKHVRFEKVFHKNSVYQKLVNLEISYKAEEAKKDAEIMRRSNEELFRLNKEIQDQKQMLERTLSELRNTQAQLIQSAKMASLGELTAGIAHEIQNPLNFVNNFSDVNREMLIELKDEIDKGNYDEVKTIANNLIENEEKINHHGRRADSIVKGMLQHSRTRNVETVLTDINALTQEYLNLAHHAFLNSISRQNSPVNIGVFNPVLKTDFDLSIGEIKIIRQDIGRVLLNLCNNAFYALCEKQKLNINSYFPTLTVTTKRQENNIVISVSDNGNGIPQNIIDKIFQPFFTTKPTGQGTGLGLSIAYDIVKAHGGEISVRNRPGQGAEFVITLNATS